MLKNFGDMFKQAKEMKSKMAEFQTEMAKQKIEVSTGGGMVKIQANGLNEIISVKIDDELINMNDREILEDLITAGMNEVNKKVKETAQAEMSKFTGGLDIPGLT